MKQFFTPRHAPNPTLKVMAHESCGHLTWRKRAEPLTDLSSYKPPTHLEHGLPLCHTCVLAQESPAPSSARLLASYVLKRITAIGFGRARKEELKELRFRWVDSEQLWVFPVTDGSFAKHLPAMAESLGCASEVIDASVVPPLPGTADDLPPARVPNWAFIKCSLEGKILKLTPSGRMTMVDIGTTSWPPDLSTLPSVESAGLPPEVPRLLVLPEVRDLASLGFTRDDLLILLAQAADMGVAICTTDFQFEGRGLLSLAKQHIRVPIAPVKPAQKSAKPQGGRPATAMVQSPEILRLRDEGLSAAKIAKQLTLSPRSVLRVIHAAVQG